MENKAFRRAVWSLLHPISVGAIFVLLFNDQWLRHHYPSWWTGKIGDFAWLVFAPFVLAALLAWLVPQRLKRHQQVVGLLSFAILGLWFSLAKTIPLAHALTVAAWEAILNWQGSQRLDATDLLMLPALLLSWRIWDQARGRPVRASHLAPVVAAVAVVATLASDGPSYSYVDAGVTSLCLERNVLVTHVPADPQYVANNSRNEESDYQVMPSAATYTSSDGGRTWSLVGESQSESGQAKCSGPGNDLQDNTQGDIRYRWQPGEKIERSTDAGEHWTLDYDLPELHQDVRRIYKPRNDTGWGVTYDTRPGPRSGLMDPLTGNVVFAMGWDGVLVRTPTGAWLWAPVGEYHLDDLSDFSQARGILFFEWWQAGALIVLVLTTSAAFLRSDGVRFFLVLFGWIGWGIIATSLLPRFHEEGDFFTLGLVALPLLLLALPLLIGAFWDGIRNYRHVLLPVCGTGLGTAFLYLFPLILWTQGTIPRYLTAAGFAVFLSAAGLIAGYLYLRPILSSVKGEIRRA